MRDILSVLSQESRTEAELKNGLADIILKLKDALETAMSPTPVRSDSARCNFKRQAELSLV